MTEQGARAASGSSASYTLADGVVALSNNRESFRPGNSYGDISKSVALTGEPPAQQLRTCHELSCTLQDGREAAMKFDPRRKESKRALPCSAGAGRLRACHHAAKCAPPPPTPSTATATVTEHRHLADKPPNSVALVESGFGPTAIATGLEIASTARSRHEAPSDSIVTIGHRTAADKPELWLPPRRFLKQHGFHHAT